MPLNPPPPPPLAKLCLKSESPPPPAGTLSPIMAADFELQVNSSPTQSKTYQELAAENLPRI